MNWSTFFAKFLGTYLLIIVAIWLLRRQAFEKEIKAVISSDGMLALTGAIHIIFGLTILILHHQWTPVWVGLITLMGYSSIFQGIMRLAFPEESRRGIQMSIDKGYWLWIFVAGALGLFLTYHGFQ